jgi:hypothetical protein
MNHQKYVSSLLSHNRHRSTGNLGRHEPRPYGTATARFITCFQRSMVAIDFLTPRASWNQSLVLGCVMSVVLSAV